MAIDFTKQDKDLYIPSPKPALVQVPAMRFLWVDGAGAPEDAPYQNAMSALYSVVYTIKMSKLGSAQPDGYEDFKVPPLEGLWSFDPADGLHKRHTWTWSSLLRVPGFVTQDTLEWAKERACAKKPDVDYSVLRVVDWEEGLCVQLMHTGPYADEPQSIERLEAYIVQNGLENDIGDTRHHHELYLKSPQRTKPENLKTVLRLPVRRI